jgi:hypothetical protein
VGDLPFWLPREYHQTAAAVNQVLGDCEVLMLTLLVVALPYAQRREREAPMADSAPSPA